MTADILDEAISNLKSTSAICFLGAGFARDATDAKGNKVPSTEDLEREICNLIGIPREDGGTLTDLAEYCQNDSDLATKLNLLLINRLTHCAPSVNQNKILEVEWRSIFTTNFDDIAERSKLSRESQIITPTTDAAVLSGEKRPIFYLHGRALDILESKLDPSLVLSESNYIDIKQKNRDLYSALVNEVHCASRVFFIGYSLRDVEIAKRLISAGEEIKSKSVIICSPTEGRVALTRLEKYGSVFPIGLEGLVEKLAGYVQPDKRSRDISDLAFVKQVKGQVASSELSREDIDHLIITGQFDVSKYSTQISSSDEQNIYCVNRDQKIAEVFDGISKNQNRYVVTSDIGNGKTTFLSQLSLSGVRRGYDVFYIDTTLREVFPELEFLLGRTERQLFIVDDIIRNREVVKFIGARLSGLSAMVCASRSSDDDNHFLELSSSMGGQIREIDLNTLNDQELRSWDGLLERWGYWEEFISESEEGRQLFLQKSCSSENRSIVLSLFKSSRLSRKIDEIVSYFIGTNPHHVNAFVAILINSLCQKHVSWGRIVQWLNIDEAALRSDMRAQHVFDFMSNRRDWYQLTSPQLADYIFKNYDFDQSILVDVYTKIVRETAYSANDHRSGFDSRENLKELMKYRFLTRLFGSGKDALTSIEAVYRRLSDVPRIRGNDQFWLQYAMSNMDLDKLAEAETYINTALGLAVKKGVDYSPHQILDQRARLYLRKNTITKKPLNTDEIKMAISDLSNIFVSADFIKTHTIRSAPFILDLLNEKIDDLDVELKNQLLELLEKMHEYVGDKTLPKSKKGETKNLKKALFQSILVLKNA